MVKEKSLSSNSLSKSPIRTMVLYVLLAWVLYVCIDIFKKSLFERATTEFIIFYYVPSIILWIVFTFLSIKVFDWVEKVSVTRKVIRLLVIGSFLGVLKNLVTWFVSYLLKLAVYPNKTIINKDFLERLVPFYFMESVIISIVIMAVLYMVDLQQKYRIKSMEALELKSQLIESQLRALKMQLQPHFLFNTYNTIAMLIRANKNSMAIDVISNMGDLLRNSLNGFSKDMTSIGEELSFIRKYLEIERIRHEGNLEVNFNIEDGTENIFIPTLLLQPVIENAFKHGFDKYIGNTELTISIFRDQKNICIEIYNTGPSLNSDFSIHSSYGIGLQNTLDRLDKLYKQDYSFDLINFKQGVKVKMVIPHKTKFYDTDDNSR